MLEHKPNKLENELCFAVYTAQKFYNRFYTESLKEFKLTYPQYITRLGLDTGTLTPLLKRMEKNGWVTRERTGEDGRKVFVSLTDYSVKMEAEIKSHVQDCFENVDMTQAEYKKNVELVKEIGDKIYDNNRELEERQRRRLRS